MLYSTSDGTNRLQAERNLAELAASPECLQTCTLLLQNGTVRFRCKIFCNSLMCVLRDISLMVLQAVIAILFHLIILLIPPFFKKFEFLFI